MNYNLKKSLLLIIVTGLFVSCASKKDIVLFSDIKEGTENNITYSFPKIQVNDILDVKITTINPETSLPYNTINVNSAAFSSIELLKLQGHLVSAEGKINLPILGPISANGKTKEITLRK
jgi:polysaccharide export outer membrane protein